jgi:hypothetical protein
MAQILVGGWGGWFLNRVFKRGIKVEDPRFFELYEGVR